MYLAGGGVRGHTDEGSLDRNLAAVQARAQALAVGARGQPEAGRHHLLHLAFRLLLPRTLVAALTIRCNTGETQPVLYVQFNAVRISSYFF